MHTTKLLIALSAVAVACAALAEPPDPTDPGPEIIAAVQSNFLQGTSCVKHGIMQI